jgi:hypothetical protein
VARDPFAIEGLIKALRGEDTTTNSARFKNCGVFALRGLLFCP